MTPSKYHIFENIMENGAFALSEQMLHISIIFSKRAYALFSIIFSKVFNFSKSFQCIILILCKYVTDKLKMCMWKFNDEKNNF